jgi:CubicO group peptidase (beta-lactamase class C family)
MPAAWRARSCSSPETTWLIRKVVLLATLALVPLSAIAQAPDCGVPQSRADGWRLATPESVGLDQNPLCAIGPKFTGWLGENVHAVLVARHGSLVYERYFKGDDENGSRRLSDAEHDPDTLHDLRSVTKSITSLILGIAIDRGWVPGVDTTVVKLLPQYADLRSPEKDRITLRHLLTMSQGLKWDQIQTPYSDPGNSETAMDSAADPYRFVLSQPIYSSPGAIWNYSSGSAALISAVLHQATGKTLDVLAREELFTPLGITKVRWFRYRSNGEPMAASGLRMLPRDLLKVGQLVLNRGVWNGRQIVSAAWIDASITPHIQTAQLFSMAGYSYGYQWWIGHSLVNGQTVDWAAGQGLGGQRLFLIPRLDMVVVVMAGLYKNSGAAASVPQAVLNGYVLASVR